MRYMRNVSALALILVLGGLLLAVEMPDEPLAVGVPAELEAEFVRMQAQPLNLGFCADEEWKTAVLEQGFPIYRVDAQALIQSTDIRGTVTPLHQQIKPSGQWYFPVMAQGRCVAMLFASREGDAWQVEGIGHSGIAGEWARIRSAWPEEAGYRLRLLRSLEGRSDLMLVEKGTVPLRGGFRVPVGYVPFLSARVALELGDLPVPERALLSDDQFLDTLRARVREAVRMTPGFSENRDR